jgi:hypothetical protein
MTKPAYWFFSLLGWGETEVVHCTTLEWLMNKLGYLIETAEKVEVANIDQHQHHFIHHKSHIDWPGTELWSPWLVAGKYPPVLYLGLYIR